MFTACKRASFAISAAPWATLHAPAVRDLISRRVQCLERGLHQVETYFSFERPSCLLSDLKLRKDHVSETRLSVWAAGEVKNLSLPLRHADGFSLRLP